MSRVREAVDELSTATRFGKFLSVGAGGAVVDLSISTTLTLGGVLEPQWAKLVGAECAIVVMFLVNDRWTYRSQGKRGRRAKLRRLLKSNLVRSGGLAVQFLVVIVLTGLAIEVVVGGTNVWAVLTMPIAIAASFAVNYVAESLFTWRVTANS